MTASIRSVTLDLPEVVSLITALNTELEQRYPEEGANHFRLDPDEVAPGRGAFLVAYEGSRGIGCGAVRLHEPGVAEIKRMYVVPEWRGRGIAKKLLAELEDQARRIGARRLILETGDRQPEALAVYRRAGFVDIPRFGEYVDSPLSVCLGKALAT
jgi:putative acetyltransferase